MSHFNCPNQFDHSVLSDYSRARFLAYIGSILLTASHNTVSLLREKKNKKVFKWLRVKESKHTKLQIVSTGKRKNENLNQNVKEQKYNKLIGQ